MIKGSYVLIFKRVEIGYTYHLLYRT